MRKSYDFGPEAVKLPHARVGEVPHGVCAECPREDGYSQVREHRSCSERGVRHDAYDEHCGKYEEGVIVCLFKTGSEREAGQNECAREDDSSLEARSPSPPERTRDECPHRGRSAEKEICREALNDGADGKGRVVSFVDATSSPFVEGALEDESSRWEECRCDGDCGRAI